MRKIQNRKSIRLKGYDYSQAGLYFITICTHNHRNLFGNIEDNSVGARCTCPDSIKSDNPKMILNEYGKIVENEIIKTNEMRKNIKIEEYVVMPNHVHFIIEICNIDENCQQGHVQRAPTVEEFGKPRKNSISTIVSLIKSSVTKQINLIEKTENITVWQRNYYENIIRNEEKYLLISEYIRNNPEKWGEDKYYNNIQI